MGDEKQNLPCLSPNGTKLEGMPFHVDGALEAVYIETDGTIVPINCLSAHSEN